MIIFNYKVIHNQGGKTMPVPKYYEFFPYILEFLSDDNHHTMKEIAEYCATAAKLTENDKREKTISSGMPVYTNRVAWARTYLSKAGLIERVARSTYHITSTGKKAVECGVQKVDLQYLRQFESFNEFFNSKTTDKNKTEVIIEKEGSPQEQIESAISKINSSLLDDIMSEVLKMSPYDFENLVVRLLIKMGYGTLKQNPDAVTKKTSDEGIDGVVSADKFGFDSIYIQAKKWQTSSTVGRPEVQRFLGALAGQGATKGIFITTAHFSKEAIDFANKQLHQKIVLVDGEQLSKLMIEYDFGVSTVENYVVKRVDYDFFNNEV